ncbi:hypothetical protein [Mycobacterium sp. 1164966.3]|uniref:hypothetical protein n=1 Tax=Mycobacterium sp. 1164966.3 TaxID=1856861 RepID=UPI0012E7CBB8|nr:hypothetical protein [Mycobacterium sp. 1164966.3]
MLIALITPTFEHSFDERGGRSSAWERRAIAGRLRAEEANAECAIITEFADFVSE